MLEIEFSVMGEAPEDVEYLNPLLEEFQDQYHVHVQVQRLTWDQAWSTLLEYALHGGGPDISQIGSTWTTTLIVMNALRPFEPREISSLGPLDVFIPSAWQSVKPARDSQVWALPWSAYTYGVFYRRDLLQQAGVDEQTAFASATAMPQTFSRLQAAGIEVPWLIPLSNLDLVHITASWIWGAGGSLVTNQGNRLIFDQPEALAGLQAYFELYRYLPPSVHHLNNEQGFELFAQGHAAVAIGGVEWIYGLTEPDTAPEVWANLGTSVLPGVPWIGGSNLGVWKKSRADYSLKREQAAVALARFLVSRQAQVECSQQLAFSLPVRFDALAELNFTPPSFYQTVEQALRTGRSHQAINLWGRIENQLGQTLDNIVSEVLANPNGVLEELLHKYLVPLASRLNRTLSY